MPGWGAISSFPVRFALMLQTIASPALCAAQPNSPSRTPITPSLPFELSDSHSATPPPARIKTPSKTPTPFPTPFSTPWQFPAALPTPVPPPQSGGSGGTGSGAAIIGAVIGAALGGLGGAGGIPGTGAVPGVVGSEPTDPNAGGIENGSEAAQRFNPDQNKEVTDGHEQEREHEQDTCQLECPAEDPGMKGNPDDTIVDENTQVIAYQAPGMSSQGAVDIANAAGAAPAQVYTSPSAFLGAVTSASAGSQSTAIFLNSHGATNGGMQGLSAQQIADAWAKGGGNNRNATIVHNECYAGAHASQIAASLEEDGFTQEQRPKQLYSRPAVCRTDRGAVPLNGEQLHQNGYGVTDQALLNATQQGGGVLTGTSAVNALQGMSSPGYTLMIQRVAPGGRRK